MKALILDTETTGLNEPEVIELSYFWIDDKFERVSLTQQDFFKPSKHIEWGAFATHHIIPADLEDCPPSSMCSLPKGVDFLIGHGVDYDWGVLGKPDIRRIDTLALAREVWPSLDSHKLSALYYYIKGANESTRKELRAAHSAAADIRFCHVILGELIKEIKATSLSHLYGLSEEARIPKIMTFGKYKGCPVAEVNRGWAKWYRNQTDTDPYLLMALSRYCR